MRRSEEMASQLKRLYTAACTSRKRWAWMAVLNRRMSRSRILVAWCDCCARLLAYLSVTRIDSGVSSRWATRSYARSMSLWQSSRPEVRAHFMLLDRRHGLFCRVPFALHIRTLLLG